VSNWVEYYWGVWRSLGFLPLTPYPQPSTRVSNWRWTSIKNLCGGANDIEVVQ